MAGQASLSFPVSQSLLKLMSIESVMPSNHLTLFFPLLLLPSIFPSIRGFSSELSLRIRWQTYWSFSINISPSNEYSGLISSRIDWYELFAVQETLKNLLQPHSLKAAILRSAFCVVQLSHPYMTTGKTVALTVQTLLANQRLCFLVCCLGFVVASHPRSKDSSYTHVRPSPRALGCALFSMLSLSFLSLNVIPRRTLSSSILSFAVCHWMLDQSINFLTINFRNCFSLDSFIRVQFFGKIFHLWSYMKVFNSNSNSGITEGSAFVV